MRVYVKSPVAAVLFVLSVIMLFISPVAAWFLLLVAGLVHGIEWS